METDSNGVSKSHRLIRKAQQQTAAKHIEPSLC